MRVRNVSYRSESSVIAAGILSSPSSSLLDRDAIFCREILLTDYAYGTRHLRQVATASRNAKAAPTLPVELCSPHESSSSFARSSSATLPNKESRARERLLEEVLRTEPSLHLIL